jgi:hypothetical protein
VEAIFPLSREVHGRRTTRGDRSCSQEDEWLGGILSFGEEDDAPAITVTMRDVRCSIVNIDPDSAIPAPEVLKAVVHANQNNAEIYGAVTRIGQPAV